MFYKTGLLTFFCEKITMNIEEITMVPKEKGRQESITYPQACTLCCFFWTIIIEILVVISEFGYGWTSVGIIFGSLFLAVCLLSCVESHRKDTINPFTLRPRDETNQNVEV